MYVEDGLGLGLQNDLDGLNFERDACLELNFSLGYKDKFGEGNVLPDLDFGLGYKGKMGKSIFRTWISAWTIKVTPFLNLDFGLGYLGDILPGPGFRLELLKNALLDLNFGLDYEREHPLGLEFQFWIIKVKSEWSHFSLIRTLLMFIIFLFFRKFQSEPRFWLRLECLGRKCFPRPEF
ncbi:unnamed protein product [Rhizophagus irregularis]|nr:unnamed protein product [Rhizophagus irregularis]